MIKTLTLATACLAVISAAEARPRHRASSFATDSISLPHPEGCPRRAFCGCGVSVKVFGKPVRDLFLARNWLKFPRTTPAAGMVAARSGHVMYILAVESEGEALVYDPNGGGHKTWQHTRSLRGYRIVNPHSRIAAHNE